MKEKIQELIKESIKAKELMLMPKAIEEVEAIAMRLCDSLKKGKKLLVFGNGGSSSDALHFATELVVRFEKNRAALAAICLNSNVAALTAIGNDFGFDSVFSRQVEALAAAGDIALAITTSGNSANILKAVEAAKKKNVFVIGFTGEKGKNFAAGCDLSFTAPASVTARVQECHILAIHIICSIIESECFE